jgi:hypothetical protein
MYHREAATGRALNPDKSRSGLINRAVTGASMAKAHSCVRQGAHRADQMLPSAVRRAQSVEAAPMSMPEKQALA